MRRQRRFYVESVEPLEDRVALAVAGLATVHHATVDHLVSRVPAHVGSALASSAQQVSSDPLPTGTWYFNANSFETSLFITSVSTNGRITGTVFGNLIDGFWDERAQKVIFIREPSGGAPNYSAAQVYTGYLFQNQRGQHVTYTLAGSFEALAGSGGTAQRNVFGWYAQKTI